MEILQILSHPFCMQNKQAYTPEVCCCITWEIIVNSCLFFYNIRLAEEFLENWEIIQFPVSPLDGDYVAIKHGIKILCHNFPQEWTTPELSFGPAGGYYPGKGGGSGYQPVQPPSGAQPVSWQLPGPVKLPPTQPYAWQPANLAEVRHQKFQALMDPFLVKFRGRCLVRNILTAAGKQFNCLLKLPLKTKYK